MANWSKLLPHISLVQTELAGVCGTLLGELTFKATDPSINLSKGK